MHKNKSFFSNEEGKKNGYRLSRQIFELAKTHPDHIKPNHIALYFWICELNNKLGWDHDVIGLPTAEAMKMVGMRDRRFYRNTLTQLDDLGLIRIVTLSPNQYVATRVEILLNDSYRNPYENRVTSTDHDESRYQYDKKTANAPYRWDDDSPPMEAMPDDD